MDNKQQRDEREYQLCCEAIEASSGIINPSIIQLYDRQQVLAKRLGIELKSDLRHSQTLQSRI
jgi:hypothetical protein